MSEKRYFKTFWTVKWQNWEVYRVAKR
jgi:hypothetical protein